MRPRKPGGWTIKRRDRAMTLEFTEGVAWNLPQRQPAQRRGSLEACQDVLLGIRKGTEKQGEEGLITVSCHLRHNGRSMDGRPRVFFLKKKKKKRKGWLSAAALDNTASRASGPLARLSAKSPTFAVYCTAPYFAQEISWSVAKKTRSSPQGPRTFAVLNST